MRTITVWCPWCAGMGCPHCQRMGKLTNSIIGDAGNTDYTMLHTHKERVPLVPPAQLVLV